MNNKEKDKEKDTSNIFEAIQKIYDLQIKEDLKQAAKRAEEDKVKREGK